MITHSTAPPSGVWKVRAMEGRLMLTIDESRVVINVPTATSARRAHLFVSSRLSTVSAECWPARSSASLVADTGWVVLAATERAPTFSERFNPIEELLIFLSLGDLGSPGLIHSR